ncbi:MAG: hypothetical protein HYX72_09980 [Acidobacteria bacterium]|nr:hypothetical protein [Acidobacteriota bacterium]
MSGSESRNIPTVNPDELEVAPGTERENLQGWIPEMATEEETRVALEKAFNYRGDVTIKLKDGSMVEGFIFDRRPGATLADSVVRVIPKDRTEKLSIPYASIAGLSFTGRDTAAGKSWEAWLKQYWQKKNAGEKQIRLEPERLE